MRSSLQDITILLLLQGDGNRDCWDGNRSDQHTSGGVCLRAEQLQLNTIFDAVAEGHNRWKAF